MRVAHEGTELPPRRTRPPSLSKKAYESKRSRKSRGSSSVSSPRSHVLPSTHAPAASVGPSWPSVPNETRHLVHCSHVTHVVPRDNVGSSAANQYHAIIVCYTVWHTGKCGHVGATVGKHRDYRLAPGIRHVPEKRARAHQRRHEAHQLGTPRKARATSNAMCEHRPPLPAAP